MFCLIIFPPSLKLTCCWTLHRQRTTSRVSVWKSSFSPSRSWDTGRWKQSSRHGQLLTGVIAERGLNSVSLSGERGPRRTEKERGGAMFLDPFSGVGSQLGFPRKHISSALCFPDIFTGWNRDSEKDFITAAD